MVFLTSKAFLTLGLLLIVFASQAVWVTFSPVVTYVAEDLGVSVELVGFLAITYPIFFLLLTIPSGVLLDRNFRLWLTFGVVTTFFAAVGRILNATSFMWLLLCQLFGAIGQPFLLNAFVPFASRLYEERRALIVSVLSLFMYLGTIFALIAGLELYQYGGLLMLILPSAAIAAIGLVLVLSALSAIPRDAATSFKFGRFRDVARRRDLWLIGSILGLGVAAFDNLATWLQPALSSVGLEKVAGDVVAISIAVGLIGVMVLPDRIAKRNLRTLYLRTAIPILAVFFAILSVIVNEFLLYVFLSIGGFLMLPAYPIIMDWIGKYHEKEVHGSATGFVGLISRALSVALTLSAVYFIGSATTYFAFLTVLILVAFVFSLMLPGESSAEV